MGNGNGDAIQHIVSTAWDRIIGVINKILEVHHEFGFESFKARMNPSVDEVIENLAFIEFVITTFLDRDVLDHDQTKAVLNSKQCVLYLQRLAAALKNKDKEEYDAAINDLRNQPQLG